MWAGRGTRDRGDPSRPARSTQRGERATIGVIVGKGVMRMKPGDRIAVETERVGQPERLGEILEIIEGPITVSYRVRWDDGHESVLTPAAGSVRVVEPH